MTTQEKILHYRERGFSRREICALTGISMYKLSAILNPETYERIKKAKREKANDEKRILGKSRTGKIGRCGTCGGKVRLPCQLCKVRGLAATVKAV